MPTTVEVLRAQALELPVDVRRTLAQELLVSCDDLAESEVDEIWAEIISQRLDAVDRGESIPVSHEEAMRRIDEAIAMRRQSS